MNRRIEHLLSRQYTFENPHVIRGLIKRTLQMPEFMKAISLQNTENKLRNTMQTTDIQAQRTQIAQEIRTISKLFIASLVTIIKYPHGYNIYYDHEQWVSTNFLRGFLVNGQGPLTGLSVFQVEEGRNRVLLDKSHNKTHFYSLLINLLIDTVGLPTPNDEGIHSVGGQLATTYFVIANYTNDPEVVIHFPDSRYTPTGLAQPSSPNIQENKLPWQISMTIL